MAVDLNADTLARVRAALESGDFGQLQAVESDLATDDLVVEYPQSGEVFHGLIRIQAMDEAYAGATGTKPSMRLREFRVQGNLGVVEGTIDYGNGTMVSAVSILELRDGKIARRTDYFGAPFEAPEWRKQYTSGG